MSCEGKIQTVIESPGWWRSHNHVSSVGENDILNRVPLCALRKKKLEGQDSLSSQELRLVHQDPQVPTQSCRI